MPLYEFRCEACGETFEVLRKMGDETPAPCTACGAADTRRVWSAAAVIAHAAPPCGARECARASTCPGGSFPGGCGGGVCGG